MNFSENERTGVLAELAVETLFHHWYWSAGRDRLDTGYDLFVEPDRKRFNGGRFLVQVKGTARSKKGSPVAKVSKSNLRIYAASRLPVFLVRSTAEGTLHWLHVQAWAAKNMKRLDGNGETSISFPADQTLDDQEGFLAYLDHALKPQCERQGGLAEAARERSQYLSSIDPRLTVRANVVNGAEHFELFATSEPASFDVHMEPTQTPENVAKLQDAIRYGIPATIQVNSFRMTGSDVFSAIGASGFQKGEMSIGPKAPRKGAVSIYPGREYSLLSKELFFPANLYNGSDGFAIANIEADGLVDFRLRGDVRNDANGSVQITLSVREDLLANAPIREHTHLGELGDWAGEILGQECLLLELRFLGSRAPLRAGPDSIATIKPILSYLMTLGRLQRIARKLNSKLVLRSSSSLTYEEARDINLMHAILRGERSQVYLSPVQISTTSPLTALEEGSFRIETALSFDIAGQPLGTVPVALDLENFKLEGMDGDQHRLVPNSGGTVYLYYNENGQTDAIMSRTPIEP